MGEVRVRAEATRARVGVRRLSLVGRCVGRLLVDHVSFDITFIEIPSPIIMTRAIGAPVLPSEYEIDLEVIGCYC